MDSPYLWLVIGLLLVFTEFFLPGGVLGATGAVMLLASILFFAVQTSSPLYLLLYIVFVGALVIGMVKFALKRIMETRNQQSIYSDDSQEGFYADRFSKELIGEQAVAVTDLRPAGRIRVGDNSYEALAHSGFIESHTPVIIIGGQGASLIVKPVRKEPHNG